MTNPVGCSGIVTESMSYWGLHANETQIVLLSYDGVDNLAKMAVARPTGGAWFALSLRHDWGGSSCKLRINNTTTTRSFGGFPGADLATYASGTLRVGYSPSNYHLRFNLVELSIHDRPLSDAEDDLLMARLVRDAQAP